MRKFMTSTLGALLILAGIAGSAGAANFTDTSFGISIDVDDALSKQPLLRDIQYFNSQDRSASLLIKRIHDLTITDYVDELRDVGYIDHRDGIDLFIAGEPIEADIKSGRGLLIPVRGRIRGQQIRGVLGAYSGIDGQGFLVVGTARPEYWASWEPRIKNMFSSVRFVEVDREAMVKNWENRLKGKKLQYKRANATGDAAAGTIYGVPLPRDYHLCSDGTVAHKPAPAGQAAAQSIPFYPPRMGPGGSTWKVIVTDGEPFLIVRDGPEQELKLEDDHDKFLLNGKPYIITSSDLCN